jgi:hypothetical protein
MHLLKYKEHIVYSNSHIVLITLCKYIETMFYYFNDIQSIPKGTGLVLRTGESNVSLLELVNERQAFTIYKLKRNSYRAFNYRYFNS